MYLNLVVLTGRCTADPPLYQGKKHIYTKYSLAMPKPFSINDTEFYEIIAFDGTAKSIVKQLAKGQMHTVVGQLVSAEYEDLHTGRTIKKTRVKAEKVYPYERQMFKKKTFVDVADDFKKTPYELMNSLKQGINNDADELEEIAFGEKSIEKAIKEAEVKSNDPDMPI